MASYYNTQEIVRSIEALKPAGEVFEIRVLHGRYTTSGYFRDARTAAQHISRLDLHGSTVYITLQRVNDACFSREQSGRFRQNITTTSDKDVIGYEWLFIDFDPVRTSGVSSTDNEMHQAQEMACCVRDYLTGRGFSDPIIAESGNGYHLLYKLDVPICGKDDGAVTLIKQFLAALSTMFSDPAVDVDKTTFNPGRICKLYGTVAQKGANTPERPHRMSRIVSIPDNVQVNDIDLLRRFVEEFSPSSTQKSASKAKGSSVTASQFDLEQWLDEYEIGYKPGGTGRDSSTIYALDECPFDSTHRDGDAKIFRYPDGAISFKCHHNSCEGKRWQDVRQLYEPGVYDRQNEWKPRTEYTGPVFTEQDIMGLDPSGLLGKDFLKFLSSVSVFERSRLSAVATVRAGQIGIKGAFGRMLREYEKEIAAANAPTKNTRPFRDANGRFQHEELARELIRRDWVCRIGGAVHVRSRRVWTPRLDVLNGSILELCTDTTKSNRAEVIAWLSASSEVPERHVSPPELIPFSNGVLDINGPDHVREYQASDTFLVSFPAAYNPDAAPADVITQTIDRLADCSAGVVKLLYQMLGLLLFRENRYRAAFFLYGESGCNGKSSLLNLIQQFVGADSCASLALQDMDGDRGRFRLAELVGKVGNLCDDLPARHLFDSSIFKAVVTGGSITAERKGEQPFTFRPCCKLIFACNELPSMSDHTGGAMSRMVVVPLQHNFSKDSDFDPRAKDKQWTQAELDYLAVCAIRGLREIIKNNGVTVPAESAELLADYKDTNDPVQAYITFCQDEGLAIAYRRTDEVYNDFRDYCFQEGFKGELKRRQFTRRICYAMNLKSVQQGSSSGKRGYFFQPKDQPQVEK